MSGIDKKTMNLADIQSEYLGFPNPYKDAPSCRYDHRALVAYWNATPRSRSHLERNMGFWTQA